MPAYRKILVALDRNWASHRAVLRGIRRFAMGRRDWYLRLARSTMPLTPDIAEWAPEGVIASIYAKPLHDTLQAMGRPIVNTAAWCDTGLPRVDVDNVAAGRLAANHLRGMGLCHFGFVGFTRRPYIRWRGEGFASELRSHGLTAARFDQDVAAAQNPEFQACHFESEVLGWLSRQPRPMGIFVGDAWTGWQITQACSFAGVPIPEHFAIISVEDDDTICGICHPPLTVIQLPYEQAGYQAAELLHRLLRGERASPTPQLLAPIGVVQGGSTDPWAACEPALASALRTIRTQVRQPLETRDVARLAGVSTRRLQAMFRRRLGHSPYQEIVKARIEAIKTDLTATHLPLKRIATKYGFLSASHFSTYFRRATGQAPRDCRAAARITPFHTPTDAN